MHHEKKIVKGTSKKYKTKKDGEKESVSKRIDLGVNSAFGVDDEVVILSIDDFNKLTNGPADEIQVLKNISADKDNKITKLSASIDKLNAELKSKIDYINGLTDKLRASEKTVDKLESDVSAKDDIIAANEKTISDNGAEIKKLKDKVTALSGTIDELKPLLLSKDETIADLDKSLAKYTDVDVEVLKEKAAKYDAADIDSLTGKADELDNAKNVIIKLQNDILLFKDVISDYKSLVDYKDNINSALKNQGLLDKYIYKKDVTDDIKEPGLKTIDAAGELLKDIPSDIIGDADSGDAKK